MANTRSILDSVTGHLDESLGLRTNDSGPALTPIPRPRDAGRRPVRNFGEVTIDLVMPDPNQPRVDFPEQELDQLAQSIRDNGQLSPIRVRWSSEIAKWIIISGERRWRATQRAGLTAIQCYFHEGDLDRSEILEQQLIENLLREDLQPIEEANAFATLMELNGWNGRQLADALRITPSKVSRAVALLDLPRDVQERIDTGQISARTAYEISKLPNQEQQRRIAERATSGKLTLRQASLAVRQRKGKSPVQRRGVKQTFLADEGWKITISCSRKATYHEMQQALANVLEEVCLRIENNVVLL